MAAYCAADAERTAELAAACQRSRQLAWVSQKGRPNQIYLRSGWLTVEQCLALPLPDTSWMTKPMRREDVLAWTELTHVSRSLDLHRVPSPESRAPSLPSRATFQ